MLITSWMLRAKALCGSARMGLTAPSPRHTGHIPHVYPDFSQILFTYSLYERAAFPHGHVREIHRAQCELTTQTCLFNPHRWSGTRTQQVRIHPETHSTLILNIGRHKGPSAGSTKSWCTAARHDGWIPNSFLQDVKWTRKGVDAFVFTASVVHTDRKWKSVRDSATHR